MRSTLQQLGSPPYAENFFDHLVSRSTYLLDLALKQNERPGSGMTLPAVVEAAAWLELAQSWDMKTYARLSSMKKNLGLAYMNIVRSNDAHVPNIEVIFHDDSNVDRQQHRLN
jgi:hypothetical protein